MTYQVPMIEVPVTLALAGVEPEEHFVYLAPVSEHRDGPETLSDYLNGRRLFFPMVAAGAPRMINRRQILWLRAAKIMEESELEVTIIERLTIMELSDGTRIEGVIPIDRPREQSRVSDVLNDPRETFVRIDEEGQTYFVNKAFIRLVIPR